MYGAKIRSIRDARGYDQNYMATQLGIEQSVYSQIETDKKKKMTDELLEKIAKVLGVSVEDIKSPTPIIMYFQDSPNSGQYSHNNYSFDQSIFDALAAQLAEKDAQIAKLLTLLGQK